MSRLHNFSAGPGVLPDVVVAETQGAVHELEGCGQGLMETSHRGEAFAEVHQRAKARVRRLLRLSDDQHVLFLHGGARTQFFQIPMALLQGGRAAYLDTGTWAAQAAEEARRFGEIVVPFSSEPDAYTHVPRPGQISLPDGLRYLHYTSNNTVAGTEFDHVPEVPEGCWRVCDASSDILSRPVDGSAFDLLYAGAQKNLGPAGTTLVVIRDELVQRASTDLPKMLRYDIHVKKDSCYNTPTTFAIYVIERVLRWLEEDVGGVEAIARRNARQAERVYGVLDGSDFWKPRVRPDSRSWMNVTFSTGSPDLDKRFVETAKAEGLLGLKGHRSVGGLRASLYNAQPDASVEALVSFLGEFERRHG